MITERAMLAAVHISIWTAVKHDRKVSRQVADEHGAPETAGRYNKKLLSGAARARRSAQPRGPDTPELLQNHPAMVG